MDATAIHQAAAATLDGTVSFPQIAAQLIRAGAEYYHADFVGHRNRFHDASGTCVITPIP